MLPQAAIEQLAARLTRTEVPAGQFVFEQADGGDNFYVIEAGQARVLIDGQPVRTLGGGDGFGEIALIRDCRRAASVRAATPLTLRGLRRAVFVAAMNGYAPSAEVVSQVITQYQGTTPPPVQSAATAD